MATKNDSCPSEREGIILFLSIVRDPKQPISQIYWGRMNTELCKRGAQHRRIGLLLREHCSVKYEAVRPRCLTSVQLRARHLSGSESVCLQRDEGIQILFKLKVY